MQVKRLLLEPEKFEEVGEELFPRPVWSMNTAKTLEAERGIRVRTVGQPDAKAEAQPPGILSPGDKAKGRPAPGSWAGMGIPHHNGRGGAVTGGPGKRDRQQL